MERNRHTSAHTLWLTPEAGDLLKTAAGQRHGMKSMIADEAIRYYFNPDKDERFTIMAKRIEYVADRQTDLGTDLHLISGTLKMFIELFLILSPPMPTEDRKAAQALGAKRFDHFIGEVRRAFERGESSLADLLLPSLSRSDDLASEADLSLKDTTTGGRP